MELNIDTINFDLPDTLSEKSKSVLEKSKSLSEKSKSVSEKSKCKSKSKCVKENTYFWEPLSETWLNKLASEKFVIRNCLGDGNCQFRSIAEALTNAGYKTTHERLRRRLTKYILAMDPKNFINIIKTYQIEKDTGEFIGNWNPMEIKNKRDFIKIIKTPGFDFQGDFVSLELLSRAIGVDIIIFTNNLDIINLSDKENLQNKIIILYYEKLKTGSGHYQTIGLKRTENSIKTMFFRSKLHEEISRILDRDAFLYFHIKNICETGMCGTTRIHLNYILKALETKLNTKLSKNDTMKILKIIKDQVM